MSKRIYIKEQQVKDITELIAEKKFKVREIAELAGVSLTTVARIKKGKFRPRSRLSSPSIQAVVEAIKIPPKLTVEDFVNLLSSLIDDYKSIKKKLAELEKSREEWRILAGRLNDQLQAPNLLKKE
jgi:transcriptional regulator with XRE-family HTH domain